MSESASGPPRSRSLGLDTLRAGALLLMVAAHVWRPLADRSDAGTRLHEIAEAAPAFFFFAFGMTTRLFFLTKDAASQREISVRFLFVALAHDIYNARLLVFDFFSMLWVTQAILILVDRESRGRTVVHAWSILALLATLALAPRPLLGAVSDLMDGPFPLVPWVVFVVAGFLFAHDPRGTRAVALGICALAAAAAMRFASGVIDLPGWEFSKWPLSAPYVLLTIGIAMCTYQAAERCSRIVDRVPFVAPSVSWISRRLMLATVLHLAVVDTLNRQVLSRLSLHDSDTERWVSLARWTAAHDVSSRVLIAVAAFAVSLLLVAFVSALWTRVAGVRILVWARTHYATVGVVLVLATEVLCRVREHRFSIAGDGLVPGSPMVWAIASVRMASTWLAMLLMIYFALEQQWYRIAVAGGPVTERGRSESSTDAARG